MKRNEIDWSEIQKRYDDGLSWSELRTTFGICSDTLSWARKQGLLTFRNLSEAAKLSWKLGKQNPNVFRTDDHRKKMSKFGGVRERSGRCKHIQYTKKDGSPVWLQGSWEVKFVSFLDTRSVNWERNRVGYRYVFDGKDHLYFPDFYLPDFGFYVEVKGYETDKDQSKWNQFPFKLIVIKKQEISDLETWWTNTGANLTAWWNRLDQKEYYRKNNIGV